VVTGEAPLVNTTSGALGGLVTDTKIEDLPLNGRNYVDLTLQQPGVALHQNHSSNDVGTWFSSNGAPPWSNNAKLDGASMMTAAGGTSSSVSGTTLGVDGIQEYRVITGTYGAEYGGSMGSQTVIISKSGSKQFHGSGFEYFRNSLLDARNYFDYGYLTPGAPRLPELQKNNFGGSFGGPIKKNKTFFYATYEGLRQNAGFAVSDTVLPAACHTTTGFVDNKTCIQPTQKANINAGQTAVNPVVQPWINLMPLPTPALANQTTGNFTFPTSAITGENYGQMRVDHNFSESDTLFGRWTISKATQDAPCGTQTCASGVAFPGFRVVGASQNQYLTVGENHVFSPALLNSARLSFSRTNSGSNNSYGDPKLLTSPAFTLIPPFAFGQLYITGLSTPFGDNVGGGGAPAPINYTLQNIYSFTDDVYYNKGKHAFKFGTAINRYNRAGSTVGNDPEIFFDSTLLFVQGFYNNLKSQIAGLNDTRFYVYNTLGFYAQDDWRVTPRLTLNLGARYEIYTVPNEVNNKQYRFTNFLGGSPETQGPQFHNPSLKNIVPRVGFAYDLTGKGRTSLRGGFGIFDDVGDIGAILGSGIQPLILNGTITPSPVNSVKLTSPLLSIPASNTKQLAMPDYNIGQPHALEYSLTVEQQLPGGIGLSVSYVGLRGLKLFQVTEGNPEVPTGMDANGNPTYINAPGTPAASARPGCANTLNSSGLSCRTNPNWLSDTGVSTSGDSWYNSLQITANKRLSRGLEFQTSFTWSKALDDTEAQNNAADCFATTGTTSGEAPTDQKLDKGPSCFDIRDVLRFNLLYHFPNVKSTHFAAKLIQGWWVGNLVAVQTGYKTAPLLTSNRSQSAVTTTSRDRPNVNNAATIAANPCSSTNPCAYAPVPFDPSFNTGNPNQWWNPAMFSLQTVGTLGNAGRGILTGPGLGVWDFSLVKDTALRMLGERGNLQFRAEFFNLMNRPNFSLPETRIFSGATSGIGAYQESPSTTFGRIGSTVGNPRQIQFALKLLF
jgi:hypothetical protein